MCQPERRSYRRRAALAWFPQLLHGTAEQRGQVRTGSRGLHWEALDEDVSIAGLLAGQGDQSLSHTPSVA